MGLLGKIKWYRPEQSRKRLTMRKKTAGKD
jgi:hypothetical protein